MIIDKKFSYEKKCFRCGSTLILINTVTETVEGCRFPQTTNTYKCTNKECQDQKDVEEEKRLKTLKERKDIEIEKAKNRKKQIRIRKK